MLDAALDGIVTIDHEGTILEFNAAAERIFGHASEDALGRQIAELLIPPSLREAHERGLRHYLATGEGPVLGKRIEVPALRADGSEFPIELSILRVDVPGPPVFTAYMRDITAAKERETALRKSEAIVGSSFDAIVGRTLEGVVTSWNAAAERIFGYSADEMIGRSISVLAPPELLGELDSINERLGRGDLVERFETVRLRKDGTRIDIESTVSPIFDDSGRIVGISAISRDITERKRSEALASGQALLLELVASGASLAEVLDLLARFVEEQSRDALVSILLLDHAESRLRHGAAPSLPEDYVAAIDGVQIGPDVGSCGAAAYRGERIVVSDIDTDPLWRDYRELAAAHGLRACWSTPIRAADGTLAGTTAMYYRQPQEPSDHDLQLVDTAVRIASIAIGRSQSEEAVRASEARYRDLFENANEPIATVSLDETITDVNVAFERVLGYSRDELLGTNLNELVTLEGYETAVRERHRKLSGEAEGTTFEQEFIAKDGQSVILEVSSRVIEEYGRPVEIQGLCRDVTVRKQVEGELRELAELNRRQAQQDGLTSLPNRTSFRQRINEAIAECRLDGTQLAVLLIDLDRFKEINATLGHHYGDRLLVQLARRFESVVRRSDTIARLGGDEFGLLLRDLGPSEAAVEQMVQRIVVALQDRVHVDELPLHVEASIGVALYPSHGADADILLQRADVAMYAAKDTGVSHVVYAEELDRHDAGSLTLLSEVPRAIRNHELVLHYQPKVDVRTGELSSVEALLRWQHPLRGLVPPLDFIPLAERTALIDPLTLFVLDHALGQSKRWEEDGHPLSVAVNLSMRSLQQPGLPGEVAGLLRKWELPPDRLTLEITESSIVMDPSRAKSMLEQLSALGVRISIDDFGVGYTSLAYLARLQLDQIKIDRCFVQNMEEDADDAAIVSSIVRLGHDLGLEVVAEGVETKAACDGLARLGCDTLQGFYISRPLPAEDLFRLLETRAAGASRDDAAA